jgi:hypothetical protein
MASGIATASAITSHQETEPWEIIYFKLYRSQTPVIEQAFETAALMLDSDRSRATVCKHLTSSTVGYTHCFTRVDSRKNARIKLWKLRDERR